MSDYSKLRQSSHTAYDYRLLSGFHSNVKMIPTNLDLVSIDDSHGKGRGAFIELKQDQESGGLGQEINLEWLANLNSSRAIALTLWNTGVTEDGAFLINPIRYYLHGPFLKLPMMGTTTIEYFREGLSRWMMFGEKYFGARDRFNQPEIQF